MEEKAVIEYPKAHAEVCLKLDPFAKPLAKSLRLRFPLCYVLREEWPRDTKRAGSNSGDLAAELPRLHSRIVPLQNPFALVLIPPRAPDGGRLIELVIVVEVAILTVTNSIMTLEHKSDVGQISLNKALDALLGEGLDEWIEHRSRG
jgi:hypothetical protein